MKTSNYNYIIEKNGYSYWYNGLEQSFFRLPAPLGRKISQELSDPQTLQKECPSFYQNLVNNGFLIEESVDELETIRERHNREKMRKDYFLVILPTLNCNFKCWYCIQDHVPSVMSSDTIESIKRHIDYMIDVEKIESLHIEWFGGEPFLYFKKVIVPISEYAIDKCKIADIPFTNSATTNGFYLTAEIIPTLNQLLFKGFQITLDGPKEHHDKVKFQKGCDSAFEHVLKNIDMMLSMSSDIIVKLRINYTHDTLNSIIVNQVNQFINDANRHKIIIIPKKVWQEKTDKEFYNVTLDVLDKFKESGHNVQKLDIVTSYLPCYANRKYYNAINYNGGVVKCTACNDLYINPAPGMLQPNGQIKWRNGFDLRYLESSFENQRCLKCKYLPICMGLCPRDHINGCTQCKMEHVDNDIEQSITEFIDEQLNNSN